MPVSNIAVTAGPRYIRQFSQQVGFIRTMFEQLTKPPLYPTSVLNSTYLEHLKKSLTLFFCGKHLPNIAGIICVAGISAAAGVVTQVGLEQLECRQNVTGTRRDT